MLRFHIASKAGRTHLNLSGVPMVFGRDPEKTSAHVFIS
jgi:hypothetical protein